MARLNPHIFREYDIRGIVGEDLDEEIMEDLGRAYGTMLLGMGKQNATVGRDCRPSSPPLARAFLRGLTSTGIDALDLGLVTTPMLYFSQFSLDVGGGAMITASHNPSEYNGIKLTVGGQALFGEDIGRLKELVERSQFEKGRGNVARKSILAHYVSYLRKNLRIEPGLRVALDCGNGTTGIVAPRVMKEFGCELTELYTTPDGTFPNHHPDPGLEENLRDLIGAVRKRGCQVGVAFDGDGDRIGVIDDRGEVVWGDMLLLIFARDVLGEVPGAKIIGDVKCSNRLYRDIASRGGKAIMWKTGHSLIKNKLKSEGAELAGEMSGHIFFKHRFLGFDDALYASLRLLEILSKTGASVSRLLEGVPRVFSTPEIRVHCPEEIKFPLVERVREELRKVARVNDLDGVRIEFSDGWGLVRASNTQPALVLRFEAEKRNRLEEIRSLIEGKIEDARRALGEDKSP